MILGIDISQANRKIRSGTEWYAFHLIEEFKKLLSGKPDLRVRLYTRDALQSDLVNNLPGNFEVRILRWPLPYFWGQIRLSIEMLLNPPDILFCPAHTIPLVHPKKTFTTLHDVGFKDYPELYDRFSLWYHRFSAWLAVKKAQHIFTVSEFSKDRIIENYRCDSSRITVTYLGVNPLPQSLPTGGRENLLTELGLKEKNYVLYIGRLEPKKNILNMVKGYEMSGLTAPFVLVGRKVRTRDVEDYLDMKSELKARIKFLNYVTEQEKWALYKSAAVFLFTTLYEGFGLPILEAQATKTPVITSNTASNPEIAGKGAVLVNPDGPYEIAKTLRNIMDNNNLKQEKIAEGLENLKRFSWEETARKTWEILSR